MNTKAFEHRTSKWSYCATVMNTRITITAILLYIRHQVAAAEMHSL